MSRDDLTPTSELLTALRELPADSEAYGAMRDRIAERLAHAAVLVGSTSSSAPAPGHAPVAEAGRAAAHLGKTVGIGWLVPAFAAGMVAGISADHVHTRLSASRAVATSTTARVTEHASPAPPAEAPAPAAEAESAPATEEPRADAHHRATNAPSSGTGTGLAAEQGLLDMARTALAKGEPGAALAPLERHARRFPKGKLSEEREALRVRILALLGRDDEAKTRAEAFQSHFPGSLFAPVIHNALDAISKRKTESAPNEER
jgi:hypothetical protein